MKAQTFGTGIVEQLLSEGRKYGLSVTVATQFLAGLSGQTRAAIIGSAAPLIAFRVGHDDALILAPEFDRAHQSFSPYSLRQLNSGKAMMRISGSEGDLVTFEVPPPSCGNAEHVKKQSRIHYGVGRAIVEAKLDRLLGSTATNVRAI